MNTVKIMKNENAATDETTEQQLARNLKEAVIIINTLLEDCAKNKITVDFSIVPVNHRKQNKKIVLDNISKNLLT